MKSSNRSDFRGIGLTASVVTQPAFPLGCWNLDRAFQSREMLWLPRWGCSCSVTVLQLSLSLTLSQLSPQSLFPCLLSDQPWVIKSNFLISKKTFALFPPLEVYKWRCAWPLLNPAHQQFLCSQGRSSWVGSTLPRMDGLVFCRVVHIIFLSVTHRPKWSPLSLRP